MIGFYKTTVVLPAVTGLPEDSAQNSFYFQALDAGESQSDDLLAITTRLLAFYNADGGAGQDLASFISDSVSRVAGTANMLHYFTDGADPPAMWGTPVGTSSWTVDPGAAGYGPLPAEVAVCLSYHADLTDVPETAANPSPPPATIRPAARLRGRLYFGPLQINASVESPDSGDAVPSDEMLDTLASNAGALLADNDADLVWVGQSKAGDEFWEIVGGYVDNAFDTQRRRGTSPTTRTIWP